MAIAFTGCQDPMNGAIRYRTKSCKCYLSDIILFCVCVYECAHVCTSVYVHVHTRVRIITGILSIVCMWRSEDGFQESVLVFHLIKAYLLFLALYNNIPGWLAHQCLVIVSASHSTTGTATILKAYVNIWFLAFKITWEKCEKFTESWDLNFIL